MTVPWAVAFIATGAVFVAAFAWLMVRSVTRPHPRRCGCRACYEANLREAYRQHAAEEQRRRGEQL